MTSGSPRDRILPALPSIRVRLASTAVPLAEDAPGPATRRVVAALAATDGPAHAWPTERALELTAALGADGALPGSGRTRDLWEALATLAAADLGIARAVEPHLDALAILDQEWEAGGVRAAADPLAGTWGVFAAEGGGDPLRAVPAEDAGDGPADGPAPAPGGAVLTGTKPWCSLAGSLSHALIIATAADGTRALYAVRLDHPGVEVVPGAWAARGLVEVPSGPLRMTGVPARRVGAPGWYLERAGFHWGAIGVAACWHGGAVGLARTLLAAAERPGADRLTLMHLGAVDAALAASRSALDEAARLVDRGLAEGEEGRLLAKRVRGIAARAAEETLMHVAHALGPAPLAQDPVHAKRVADLELYVRQHHAERDDASLGGALVEAATREVAREAAREPVERPGDAAPATGVAFDAREPGVDADVWPADPRWDAIPELRLDDVPALLVVSAHADDESVGAGGLLAAAAARGVPVTLAIVTDGAASHPGSPTVTPAELAAIRRDEARAALDAVAPGARLVLLGHPDGGVREARDAVRADLAALVAEAAAGTWVAAPWRGDGHRDHRVTGEVVAELVAAQAAERGLRLVEYPVWMWHWATPDDARVPWADLRALPLDPAARQAKRAAMDAHASQVRPLSDAPEDRAVLLPAFLRHAERDREVLIVADRSAEPTPAGSPSAAERFDAAYARDEDPWRVTTRWYERRKRLATLAALPDERYGRALEIGCSIGVTSAGLAERVDELLAVDVAPTAVERARARLADAPHVRVEVRDVGADWPAGAFDLVVMSEVGYYLDDDALDRVLAALPDALGPSGTLVACHWRHPEGDFRRSGDEVHARLAGVPGLTRILRHEEDDFLLEVLSADPRSVAARTGLR
ncbi:PIG-L family deacetylase [Clavibacter sp. CT19]|uniref:PIG-L family deacetylase n=1 Tax=Clavibacter sp. CT19 TaxID=3018990 RepID=UPI0022EB7473|nr:PIG-L family deacetylase [Clavibacter sp. CT19]MDA3804057.1 PIG-L family deacetylase [Clavibacter sp. CT19]